MALWRHVRGRVLRCWRRGPPPCTLTGGWADGKAPDSGTACSALRRGGTLTWLKSAGLPMPAVCGSVTWSRARYPPRSPGRGAAGDPGARAYLKRISSRGRCLNGRACRSALCRTVGVERHRVIFRGQTAHSGATPMDMRRDVLAAAATALAVGVGRPPQGVGTVGAARLRPGIVTAVAETVISWTRSPGRRCAGSNARRPAYLEGRPGQRVRRQLGTGPTPAAFADGWWMVRGCAPSSPGGNGYCRRGRCTTRPHGGAVLTAMLFTSSAKGTPRPDEDTPEEHLRLGVEAFYRTVPRDRAG